MPEIARPIYTLEITAEHCDVHVVLNGFPAYQLHAKYKTNFAKPINSVLVGKDNSLKVYLTPIIEHLSDVGQTSTQKPKASVAVKIYQAGEISAPENGVVLLQSDQSVNAGEYHFDNDVLSFRQTFLEADRIKDRERLLLYAQKLLGLAAAGNAGGLLSEFKPKLNEMGSAYYKDQDTVLNGFKEFLTNEFFPLKPITNIRKEELVVKPWCDERIWELGVLPDENLLNTEPDEEDEKYTIRVFAGLHDGELKVIR